MIRGQLVYRANGHSDRPALPTVNNFTESRKQTEATQIEWDVSPCAGRVGCLARRAAKRLRRMVNSLPPSLQHNVTKTPSPTLTACLLGSRLATARCSLNGTKSAITVLLAAVAM